MFHALSRREAWPSDSCTAAREQYTKLRSQRSHTSTTEDFKNPASLCRRGLPLALRLAGGGKAASEALNIGDGDAFDGVALAAVVFLCFKLGPKRVVEAVDHVEHRRRQSNLNNLSVAEQALHILSHNNFSLFAEL